MNKKRLLIKNIYYLFLCLIGKILKFFNNEKEICVLMYHSVDETSWKYGVKEKDLEKQIKYISDNYKVVELKNIIDFVKGNVQLEDKTIAITIDDGYLDTYEKFFPLLKKYNLPATVFLTTNFDRKEKLGNLSRPVWRQIKEMYESGLVKFEAHGRNHINLKDISDDVNELQNEIIGARDDIENNLGYKSKVFAYAGGKKNEQIMKFLKENQFEAAFSINQGLVNKKMNIFSIKRIQVDKTMNFFLFKMRLTKAIDLNR